MLLALKGLALDLYLVSWLVGEVLVSKAINMSVNMKKGMIQSLKELTK